MVSQFGFQFFRENTWTNTYPKFCNKSQSNFRLLDDMPFDGMTERESQADIWDLDRIYLFIFLSKLQKVVFPIKAIRIPNTAEKSQKICANL